MDFRGIKELICDTLKYIIVIVLVILIAVFIFSFQQVIGPSMKNTLHEQDVIIVNKFKYFLSPIKRGDIVSISVNEKIMIKRIIGLPGDTIKYKDNILYINNKTYKEDYIKEYTDDFPEVKIPKDKYFVLGDNRNNSQDSRDFGVINKKQIIGSINIRIYPFNKISFIK